MRSFYFFLFYFFLIFGYAQNKNNVLQKEYEKLATSNIDYLSKIDKINRLLENNFTATDSIALSILYNEFG